MWNLGVFLHTIAIVAAIVSYWVGLCYTGNGIQCEPDWYTAAYELAGVGLAVFFATAVVAPVLIKWVVLGRYRAGIYPLFGKTHLAHWITNIHTSFALAACSNTIMEGWLLSALGAKVGSNVSLRSAVVVGGFDLLRVDDNVVIGFSSILSGVVFDRGMMRIGPIHIASNSVVGTYCTIGPHSSLDGRLMDLSAGSGNMCGTHDGVPAKCVGPSEAPGNRHSRGCCKYFVWSVAFWLCRAVVVIVAAAPWLLMLFAYWPTTFDDNDIFANLVCVCFVGHTGQIVVKALMCRLHGPIASGICERFSFQHLRLESKTSLCDFRHQPFGGTLIFNIILKLHGYDISFFTDETDVPLDSVSDMLSIGHHSFTTAGHIARPSTYTPGHVIMDHIHIGNRSMVGKVAVMTPGVMEDDLLLGVMTRSGPRECKPDHHTGESQDAHAKQIRYGRPASNVPIKSNAAAPPPPALWQFVLRLFSETSLLFIPLPWLVFSFAFFRLFYHQLALATCCSAGVTAGFGLVLAVTAVTTEMALLVYIIALKALVLGRVRTPTTADLWAPFTRQWHVSYAALAM